MTVIEQKAWCGENIIPFWVSRCGNESVEGRAPPRRIPVKPRGRRCAFRYEMLR
jgi:hypothetical protein